MIFHESAQDWVEIKIDFFYTFGWAVIGCAEMTPMTKFIFERIQFAKMLKFWFL